MLRKLVVLGLIAGICAGLLGTGFAQLTGEPAIVQAIEFERAQASASDAAHPELLSRSVQSSIGLLLGAVIYGLAFGGLFALAFAAVYGRVTSSSPARTARALAVCAFVVIFLVPFLKYPAAPPGIGDPDTIGDRTILYATLVAISLLAAVAAVRVRAVLRGSTSRTDGILAAVVAYLGLVTLAGFALPAGDVVPGEFPAATLWQFRAASLGMQAIIWATIGLVFAAGVGRVIGRSTNLAANPAAVPRTDANGTLN